jgi:mono/diheme cytochrome c family protein
MVNKVLLVTLIFMGGWIPASAFLPHHDSTIAGETYTNAMPQYGFLSNPDVTSVLKYIRQNFGNNATEIAPEKVSKIRNLKPEI